MTVLAFLEGQAFWEPFLEAVPRALSGPFFHVSCQGQSGAVPRNPTHLTDHSFARSFARSRHEGTLKGNALGGLRSAAEGGSKTHTQSVHAWPSTDLHRQHSAYAPAFKPHQLCGLKAREPPLRGMLGLRPR